MRLPLAAALLAVAGLGVAAAPSASACAENCPFYCEVVERVWGPVCRG